MNGGKILELIVGDLEGVQKGHFVAEEVVRECREEVVAGEEASQLAAAT